MHRSGLTGWDGSSVFSSLRNPWSAFNSVCTSFHPPESVAAFPFLSCLSSVCSLPVWSSPLWPALDAISSCFWLAALWWVSLSMFSYLLVACTSTFEKCVFTSLALLLMEYSFSVYSRGWLVERPCRFCMLDIGQMHSLGTCSPILYAVC